MQIRSGQRRQHQRDDFNVALGTGIAVELGTDLDRAARGQQVSRLGMQHIAAGVAVPGDAFPRQRVSVHPGHLLRVVRAQAHQATAGLIGDLVGQQIEIVTDTGQQGFEEFGTGRNHQIVSPGAVFIQ